MIWWDTAGQERFRSVTTSYIRGAQGIMLVLDVTNPQALETMERWIGELTGRVHSSVKFLLTANKIDSPERAITDEQLRAFADKYSMPFVKTSAKTGENVNDAFETLGQLVADAQSTETRAHQTSQQL
jgi:small GTP-binding protein